MNDAVTYQDYRAWADDTYPDGNVTCGRFDEDAMQEAFEAGYSLAMGRMDGSGAP